MNPSPVRLIATHPIRRLLSWCLLAVCFLSILHLAHRSSQAAPASTSTPHTSKRDSNRGSLYVPRIHQPLSWRLLRGIIVYYPDNEETKFFPELRWLYRTWIEMMKFELPFWRTDLVIYSNNYTTNLQNLGCVFNRIRINREQLPECRVFPYRSLSKRRTAPPMESELFQRIDEQRSTSLSKNLRSYAYADSINIMSEYYLSFAMYDFVLRTDTDVFLTKNFGRYVPYNDTLLTGVGGYSTEFSTARLKRIARDMSWSNANIVNIGSTWYGPPRMVQRAANYTLAGMLYLTSNEFTNVEREGRLGTLLWPEWHYGVLLLYGSHLAINHLVASEDFQVGLAYELLDQKVVSRDQTDIERNRRLHLHCWHGMTLFSKFQFKLGSYNHISPETLRHDTSAAGYALRMALESRRMTLPELQKSLRDAKNATDSD